METYLLLKNRKQKIKLENHLISLQNNRFLITTHYHYYTHNNPRTRFLHWEGLAKSQWISYEIFIDINDKNSTNILAHLPNANKFILQNKSSIPHTYAYNKDKEIAKLCLFYPKNNEFRHYDLVGETIGYWIVEWLNYYEFWTATAKWYGGGHSCSMK